MDNMTMEMAENENVTNESAKSENASQQDLYLDGPLFAKMAQGGAAQLRSNAEEVNKLNVFPVPDGDTGDNMRMTIESGIAALEKFEAEEYDKAGEFALKAEEVAPDSVT